MLVFENKGFTVSRRECVDIVLDSPFSCCLYIFRFKIILPKGEPTVPEACQVGRGMEAGFISLAKAGLEAIVRLCAIKQMGQTNACVEISIKMLAEIVGVKYIECIGQCLI